ncbi:zinc-dependent alcohol dehydrogenase family protein [Jeotgalibacillus marinus]|uniref:Zinc-dependent alcohol dehydrogenase family protein n=1 Tax=Jeotgalibacillus marinus TaxID=86667 RepID=A0ABV3Q7G2_9BACL
MKGKCIKYYEFGRPQDVLKSENNKVTDPVSGELLVRMITRPINPSDIIPIRGAYSHRISLPAIPGYEGVGVVEEVGPSVSQELLGKRVLPLRGEGTWQDFVKIPEQYAVPIPSFMDDFIAAQLYINPITAWVICTQQLQLTSDDVLLINAGGSSVGRIFAQLSKIIGFRLIAVTRNGLYTDDLLNLGASHVINTSQDSLIDTVLELTEGQGATAAIDSIGGLEGTKLAFCIRPNGTLLMMGLLSGIPINGTEIVKRTNIHMRLFHLRHWNKQTTLQTWQETFHDLIELIQDSKLHLSQMGAAYHLFDVQEAVKKGEFLNKGKIFLTS